NSNFRFGDQGSTLVLDDTANLRRVTGLTPCERRQQKTDQRDTSCGPCLTTFIDAHSSLLLSFFLFRGTTIAFVCAGSKAKSFELVRDFLGLFLAIAALVAPMPEPAR